MKVKELITILLDEPMDDDVVIYNAGYCFNISDAGSYEKEELTGIVRHWDTVVRLVVGDKCGYEPGEKGWIESNLRDGWWK